IVSDTFCFARDGRVEIVERYEGSADQRRVLTDPNASAAAARLLATTNWKVLESQGGPGPPDGQKTNIDTRDKSVSVWSTDDPVFNELLQLLEQTRSRAFGKAQRY